MLDGTVWSRFLAPEMNCRPGWNWCGSRHSRSWLELVRRSCVGGGFPLTGKTYVNRAMTGFSARDRARLVVPVYQGGLVRQGELLPER